MGVTTHGHSRSDTYVVWSNMNARCLNPRNPRYADYGGRGINVCDRWRYGTPNGFMNFLGDMGERPDGLTLDRRDNDGGYEKSNCQWVAKAAQNRNSRRSILLDDGGVSMCLQDFAEKYGIHKTTVRSRLKRWPL